MSNPFFKVFFLVGFTPPNSSRGPTVFFWFVTRWCLGANSPKAMDAKDRAGLDRGGGQLNFFTWLEIPNLNLGAQEGYFQGIVLRHFRIQVLMKDLVHIFEWLPLMIIFLSL